MDDNGDCGTQHAGRGRLNAAKTPRHAKPSPPLTATSSTPAPKPSASTYGDAFQTIAGITSGDGWATAEHHHPRADRRRHRSIPIPPGAHRRCLPNSDRHNSSRTRGRRRRLPSHSNPAQRHLPRARTTHDRPGRGGVGHQGRDRKRHHTHRRATESRWPCSPVSRCNHSALHRECRRNGSTKDSTRFNGSHTPRSRTTTARQRASPDSLSWLIFLDADGVGTTLADQLAPQRPPRPGGHCVNPSTR